MAFEPSAAGLIGAAAGVLVILVGAFVVYARPGAAVSRAFLVLALADGLSTLAARLAPMATDAPLRSGLVWAYWLSYVPFVAALAAFGLTFPLPRGAATRRIWSVAAGAAALLLLALVLRPAWFFTPTDLQGIPFRYEPLGLATTLFFVATTGVVLWKLSLDAVAGRAASQRRQAAVLFAGLALSNAPYAGALLMSAFATGAFSAGPWPIRAFYLGLLVFGAAFLGLVARVAAGTRFDREDRRIMLAGAIGVVALSLASFLMPGGAGGSLLRALGLLAYPILIAYAIVRYDVFDIDAKVRKALVFPLTVGALGVVFVLVGSLVENAIQARLAPDADASMWSMIPAALASALLLKPVVRASERALQRVLPSPSEETARRRAVEMYGHSLAAAMDDGALDVVESRALKALRRALEITPEEHEALVRELTAGSSATG